MITKLGTGTAHKLPKESREVLLSGPNLLTIWNSLTPLARNEWICWVVSVKQAKTRQQHIDRLIRELQEGQRRPCCWIGCTHRTDKPLSPSVKYILNKKAKDS